MSEKGKKGEKQKRQVQYNGAGSIWYDLLQNVVITLVFFIVVFVFFGRICGVQGQSMEDTLHDGDRLLISNLFYTPDQGDIVVLRKDTFRADPIVKRVVAVAGQRVRIDFVEGTVYVDDEAVFEEYIKERTYRPLDFTEEVKVPEGCVFVMGDNRNRSNDSRDADIGFVDTRYIIGRAVLRVYPFEDIGILRSPQIMSDAYYAAKAAEAEAEASR